jgi:geranylgeranyl diphosphate synthase, type II
LSRNKDKRVEKHPDDMDIQAYLSQKKAIVDRALNDCFIGADALLSDLTESMRYSLLAGGKRLRPILCIAGAEAVGGRDADVLPIACALELIHTYSLIHDDLPVMDNDDLRRGRPTNHKMFGEAVALLAGDGLLTEAFHLMTAARLTPEIPAEAILNVIGVITKAAGYQGMIGGQLVDIQSEGRKAEPSLAEFIHTHKTGALIAASVTSGAILAGADQAQLQDITNYGEKIGLTFQIADDILDIEGDSLSMGKRPGGDEERGKITYPSAMGLTRSKEIAAGLVSDAILSLRAFDAKAEPLRQIASYIVERKK